MNKVILVGRLTKDSELKFLPGNGTAVSNFTLAVDRQFKNKDGQKEADFLQIVFFGKGAEVLQPYLLKGTLIALSGRIQTRSYDNQEGKKVYVTEIVAEEIKLLGGNNKHEDSLNQPTNSNTNDEMTPVDDGDIPF
jgi:single-strand DNA-binding protein